MIQAQHLSRQAFDVLHQEILEGSVRPGQDLPEVALSARLGVSRTPVRQALHRLASLGLVELLPNRRAQVRRLSREELSQIYQLREALEGMAAGLASGRLTRGDVAELGRLSAAIGPEGSRGFMEKCHAFDVALHARIAERSGNPILASEIRKYHDLVQLVRGRVGNRGRALARALRQHRALLAALKSGEARAATRAATEHVRSARELALLYAAEELA
jgi:DNA-binding GntR family transcriptional regulator